MRKLLTYNIRFLPPNSDGIHMFWENRVTLISKRVTGTFSFTGTILDGYPSGSVVPGGKSRISNGIGVGYFPILGVSMLVFMCLRVFWTFWTFSPRRGQFGGILLRRRSTLTSYVGTNVEHSKTRLSNRFGMGLTTGCLWHCLISV